MRIDIRILSGSRIDECLQLSADEFCVGGEPSCDVYFDPEKDPPARGVCARIRREDDGWRIYRLSGRGLMLNQQIVESDLPIRSGDVVRLSPAGPDLRFSISTLSESGRFPAPAPISAKEPVVEPTTPATACVADVKETTREWWRSQLAWTGAAAIVAAAVLLVVFLVAFPGSEDAGREMSGRGDVSSTDASKMEPGGGAPSDKTPPAVASHSVPVKQPEHPAPDERRVPETESKRSAPPLPTTEKLEPALRPEEAPPAEPEVKPKSALRPEEAPPAEPEVKPKPGLRPEEALPAGPEVKPGSNVRVAGLSPLAVLAIENKRNQELEPYAVACAVEQDGRQVLLTTARIARIMALFQRQYYAILWDRPDKAPLVVKVKGDGVFMHLLYMNLTEQENLQAAQYFDVGVLMVADKLPAGAVCRVASKANVDGVKPGSMLQCWSIRKPPGLPFSQGAILDHQYRLTARKQSVQLSRGIPLTEGNGGEESGDIRRLFELSGPRENFLEGSPVLNSQGEVVALYSAAIAPTDNQGRPRSPAGDQGERPKAALVDAEMLAALWTGLPSRQWFAYLPESRPGNPADTRNK